MGKVTPDGSEAKARLDVQSPAYLKHLLKSLTDRASRGDKDATANLARLLADYPHLKQAVRQLDDLITRTEAAWIMAAAFDDALARETIRKEVDSMKTELLGPSASLLERILVTNVTVAHLANQRAALIAAKEAETPALMAARDRRAESAQRRLNAAIKAYELFRAKSSKGISPPSSVALFAGRASRPVRVAVNQRATSARRSGATCRQSVV